MPLADDTRHLEKVEDATRGDSGDIGGSELASSATLASCMLPRTVRQLLDNHRR